VGLLLLSVVFVNSLFTRDSKKSLEVKKESPIVSIDISDMFKGQIRKIRWDKKEVAILLRQFPKKLTSISTLTSKNELHPVLNKATRSINREYFVYLNTGDSNNCPLYYSGGEFKDVCSSNKFDESGRMLTGSSLGFQNYR